MSIDNKEIRLRIIEALMPSAARLGFVKTDEVVLKVARELEEYITREQAVKEAVKPVVAAKPVVPAAPAADKKEKVVNYAGMK